MPLSARLQRRRRVQAKAVGLLRRAAASLVDAVPPTVCLLLLVRGGAVGWIDLEPPPGILPLDHALLQASQSPGDVLEIPLAWMILWSAFAAVSLLTVGTTLGKRVLRLTLRQRDGRRASPVKRVLRVLVSWLVPLSLGLAYVWIAVSPERRGWHDQLSGTYVVRDQPSAKRAASPRRAVPPT